MVYIQLPMPKERLCSKKNNSSHLALSKPSRCYPLTAFHILMRTLLVFVLLAAAGFAQAPDFAEWRKKAEAGDAIAQAHLGFMYAKGEGVPKDDVEAVKWLRKATESKDAARAREQAAAAREQANTKELEARKRSAAREQEADAHRLFFKILSILVFAIVLYFYILNFKKLEIKTEGGYEFTTQITVDGLFYLWPLSIILCFLTAYFLGWFSLAFVGFAIYKQYQWNKSCEKCYAINSYKYKSTVEENSYRIDINKTVSHRDSKGKEYSTSHYTVPGTKVVEKQLWRCGHCSHERYETKTSTYEN